MKVAPSLCMAVLALGAASEAPADWVGFVDETATRLVAETQLGIADVKGRFYAWGDVDRDGDTDLIVVRKQPFFNEGDEPNVLLINENGVLTDRTAEFASASTVEGDQGFLTPISDRAATLVDVNLDGWLDIVTAPTLGWDEPKHIGHPRIYINLGCTGACDGTADWQGFMYDEPRVPELLSHNGSSGYNPCFFHVAAGDVGSPNGPADGYPDLWFSDVDAGSISCGNNNPDFNNKLLMNLGAANPGYFVDVTSSSFSQPFEVAFSESGVVADMNNDGVADIVRQSVEEVVVGYNNPQDVGWFDTFNAAYPIVGGYMASPGDLNNDGRIDLLITDAGVDRYVINTSTSQWGFSNFVNYAVTYSHTGSGGPAGDEGLGGRSEIADLDNDGWDDALIADINAEDSACMRRMHVYRNLGGNPGDHVVLQEQTTGSGCETFFSNPASCSVAGIPADRLEGVFHTAVFDLDGDGWKDLVVGRCTGTEIYINQPPGAAAGGVAVDGAAGSQLVLGKNLLGSAVLSWGPSCVSQDNDYAIYEGSLSAIGSHEAFTCTTAGATTYSVGSSVDDAYFLVVPHNDLLEGSYGVSSDGGQRAAGIAPCRPQFVAECGSP